MCLQLLSLNFSVGSEWSLSLSVGRYSSLADSSHGGQFSFSLVNDPISGGQNMALVLNSGIMCDYFEMVEICISRTKAGKYVTKLCNH
jgi:hypothetical protein